MGFLNDTRVSKDFTGGPGDRFQRSVSPGQFRQALQTKYDNQTTDAGSRRIGANAAKTSAGAQVMNAETGRMKAPSEIGFNEARSYGARMNADTARASGDSQNLARNVDTGLTIGTADWVANSPWATGAALSGSGINIWDPDNPDANFTGFGSSGGGNSPLSGFLDNMRGMLSALTRSGQTGQTGQPGQGQAGRVPVIGPMGRVTYVNPGLQQAGEERVGPMGRVLRPGDEGY